MWVIKMNKEPLKGKMWDCVDTNGGIEVFSYKDVKSAVGWLIDQLVLKPKVLQSFGARQDSIRIDIIEQKIKDAFPDIFN